MRNLLFLSIIFIFIAGAFTAANAQSDVGIKANFAGGEVISIDNSRIALKTKDGVIDVLLIESTQFKRVPQDNFSLKAAVDSSFGDIGNDDRLLVTGVVSADKLTISAKVVYLVSKSELAARKAAESAEWRTRGLSGLVVSVNPLSREIIVTTGTIVGQIKTTVSLKDNVVFLRYAPDSIEFNESQSSSLSEISPGDMFRSVGEKGVEGTFQAEKILTGAFSTTLGTVTATDVEKNEVIVKDLKTNKMVTVVVKTSSIVKNYPPEIAQRFAMMQIAAAGGTQIKPGERPQGAGEGQGSRPTGNGNEQTGRPGGGGGVRGSIDDMLVGFPTITVADLKAGDTIAVSSTKTSNSDRITAIKLLSGIEPFLKVQQMAAGRGGRGGQGGQGGGQNSGVSIPGLDDGFGIP